MTEWIYCKDKMPEQWAVFLIAYKYSTGKAKAEVEIACYDDRRTVGRRWTAYSYDASPIDSWADVYAWMPLPDPPPVPEGT